MRRRLGPAALDPGAGALNRHRPATVRGGPGPLILGALFAGLVVAAPGFPPAASAQEPSSPEEGLDVDGLFESDEETDDGAGDTDEGEDGDDEEGGSSPPPVMSRLEERDPVDLEASVRFTGGYSPGWSEPLGSGGDYEDLPVVELSSSLSLLFSISPALSISQEFSFAYPDYDFEVKELAMDYNLADTAFLTFGLKRINWGRSPNFAFANVPQRQAESPLGPDESENTIVARASVPVDVGGIELLAQNKAEYHEDLDAPSAEHVGFGAKYNWAGEHLDLDLGGYYQSGLAGRLFASGTTTVADWLELYGEGVVADGRLRADDTLPEQDGVADGKVRIAPGHVISDNNPDFGAALGVVAGLFDNSLDLNAEYYYNGEETEGEVAGARFPLFYGHNLALNADYRVPDSPVRLRAAHRYNETFDSSFFAPRITVDVARHLTFDAIGGMLWGTEDAGYRAENPDDGDRPTFVAFTLTLHGQIR